MSVQPSRFITMTASLMLALVSAAAPAFGQGSAEATPQRPSISFGSGTVPQGRWEIEAGGLVAAGGSAVPLFLKYGLTARTELEAGLDLVRTVEEDSGTTSSVGDLVLGFRSRLWSEDRHALAVAGLVKAPTAVDGVGSGEVDAGLVGIFSTAVAGMGLDTNVWITALGDPDGSTLGQVQAVATLGLPGKGCWSPFVEVALQRTAGSGDGGFADAGVACATASGAVFDLAAGAGWSDGYPDWSLTAGWTFTLGSGG